MERKVTPVIGVVRLIVNGNVVRQARYQTYNASKKLITQYTKECHKIVLNPNNIVYLEITKY